MTIRNREIIYETLKAFCDTHDNCFLHDPSEFIKENPALYLEHKDDEHFSKAGHKRNFEVIKQEFLIW